VNRDGEGTKERIPLDLLPIAAVLSRDGVVVAVNAAYRELLGWSEQDVVGRTVWELIDRLVTPTDRLLLQRAAKERADVHKGVADPAASRSGAQLWCTLLDKQGRRRPVRVEWRVGEEPRETVSFFIDAEPEAYGQEVTALLARSAGELSRCATEDEVLERACESLSARGFTVTAMLIDDGSPHLRFGPTRRPFGVPQAPSQAWMDSPPRREFLQQVNPGFLERRAAFFQDGVRLVRDAFPEPIAEALVKSLPATRMVQAPLFVADRPFGAFAVTGHTLTPLVATAIELFAELVGHALANVQLRREKVERERLAALGEAAAVMAHEVRNPVGAILNALAVSRRAEGDRSIQAQMLAVISQEAERLEQLVTQLLELGRPMVPRPRSVELGALAQASIHLLESRGECARGRIELAASAPCQVRLDPDLAQLALQNVLRNAVQSSPPDARILVGVERLADSCAWVVEDQGPGIPPEVLSRLGEPFTTTRATGTGMGLAVVRRVLEASRGRLDVGRAPHGGSVVRLWFPAG
jgi:two-component system, NtrC family, sensor histidine kinase HydH